MSAKRKKRKTVVQQSTQLVDQNEAQQPKHGDSTVSNTVDDIVTSVARPETPSTTQAPSEHAPSTNPTTPSSTQAALHPALATSAKATHRNAPHPIMPALPRVLSKQSPTISDAKSDSTKGISSDAKTESDAVANKPDGEAPHANIEAGVTDSAPAPSGPPKSWANLFKGPTQGPSRVDIGLPGTSTTASAGFAKANNESLSDALVSFSANTHGGKISFLEPRGLVNTGNVCYMNSVSLDHFTKVIKL
jgi:ubiquitin carboxyl-terminal hydrolase 10